MALQGAAAALAVPDAWVKDEQKRNDAARSFTQKWFADHGYTPTDSQTNFMFVNIKRPAREFREACLKQGVLVGRDFPPYEKTHCRISVGTMEEMQKAVQVFEQVAGAAGQGGRLDHDDAGHGTGREPARHLTRSDTGFPVCVERKLETRFSFPQDDTDGPMEIDRRAFLASVGGLAVVEAHGSRGQGRGARALHDGRSSTRTAGGLIIDGEAQVVAAPPDATIRRGAGSLFGPQGPADNRKMAALAPMSDKPTLLEFFEKRFAPGQPRAAERHPRAEDRHERGDHPRVPAARRRAQPGEGRPRLVGRADDRALRAREGELGDPLSPGAALLSRFGQRLRVPGALHRGSSARTTCRSRTSRRPTSYARNHKWYIEARMVTVNDLYAFDPNAKVSIEPFIDIIGRHFKQPKEGLGNDNSPTAHMWRTMMFPDNPL